MHEGVEIAVRDAVVKVRQIGGSVSDKVESEVRVGVVDGGSGKDAASSLSFVAAICVRSDASRRSSSGDG